MAPSTTKAVTNIAEHLKAKAIPSTKKSDNNNAADVTNEELPKLNTGHHVPLKLSGILDQFEYFDTTPIIGREFADVDLAEWLRAPNSDELLRDLSITSKELTLFILQDRTRTRLLIL